MLQECEWCHEQKPNCGPWKDRDGKRWEHVCGGCKFRHAVAQPGFAEEFARGFGMPVKVTVNPNIKDPHPWKKN